MSLRKFLATLASLALAAAVIVVGSSSFALAQDQDLETLDADTLYFLWHTSAQAQEVNKAIEIAEVYVRNHPDAEQADYLRKWILPYQLDGALKANDTAKIVEYGRQVVAANPEDVNVPWTIAQRLYLGELVASPPKYDNADAAAEFSRTTIKLIEAGKTPAAENFNKEATLGWLNQALAIVESQAGNTEAALEHYAASTALAPDDRAIAGRNLYAVYVIRSGSYNEAARALAAAQEAGDPASPSPELEAARTQMEAEADALIEAAARFVAFADAKGLSKDSRDRVYGVAEKVYVSRHPEDAEAAGLQTVIDGM